MSKKNHAKLKQILTDGYTVSSLKDVGRIDQFLVNKFGLSVLAGFSRTKISELLRGGIVSVNGIRITKPSRRLNSGDLIQIDLESLNQFSTTLERIKGLGEFTKTGDEKVVHPENLNLNIIYEDRNLMVVDKDSGMVVHPAHGHFSGTLANALAWYFRKTGVTTPHRVGIVHRLDKDVSGLMVIAKNNLALTCLSEQFSSVDTGRGYTCKAKKYYFAVVESVDKMKIERLGLTGGKYIKMEGYIKRDDNDRKKFEYISGTYGFWSGAKARYCLSYVKLQKKLSGQAYLLKIRLVTGRTHQIRVQLASLGLPVKGDNLYGNGGGEKIMLRCVKLDIIPPGVYPKAHNDHEIATVSPFPVSDEVSVVKKVKEGIMRLIVTSKSDQWLDGEKIRNG